MDKKVFKKILNDCLQTNEFSKVGKYYIKESHDVLCSVGIQKSNYSNCYYIESGFFIKEISMVTNTTPREVDGDIRYRFQFNINRKVTDCIEIESINDSELISMIELNIKEFINPSLNIAGLKKLIKSKPFLLYQTKLNAKQFLGLKV